MVEQKKSADAYKGWMELVQIRSVDKSDSCTLIFPLNETKTYVISSSNQSDFVLPTKMDDTKIFIHVDKEGKVELENASSPSSFEGLRLSNNSVLYPNDRTQLLNKMTFSIGLVGYMLRRAQSPGVSQLKTLLGNLQCAVCLRFLDNAQSLPCFHVFCQQCLVALVRVTGANPRNVVQRTANGQEYVALSNEPMQVACPVCRQFTPSKEAASSRPEKVLSSVSKMFQGIVDSRPMCATCSNTRWLMHSSDYYFCESCDQVNCPLCTLDFHRAHKLRNNFAVKLEKSRAFVAQTNPAKQRYAELLKIVEKSRNNIKNINAWMDSIKRDLEETSKLINDLTEPLLKAYMKVTSLEEPNNFDPSENAQTEALESFRKLVAGSYQVLHAYSNSLNIKLAILETAQRSMCQDTPQTIISI